MIFIYGIMNVFIRKIFLLNEYIKCIYFFKVKIVFKKKCIVLF